jgi:hypothetical protein
MAIRLGAASAPRLPAAAAAAPARNLDSGPCAILRTFSSLSYGVIRGAVGAVALRHHTVSRKSQTS